MYFTICRFLHEVITENVYIYKVQHCRHQSDRHRNNSVVCKEDHFHRVLAKIPADIFTNCLRFVIAVTFDPKLSC